MLQLCVIMPKGKGKHASKEPRENRKKYRRHRYTNFDPEYQSLLRQLFTQGMKLKDMPGDGNCLFRALADQLNDSQVTHHSLRIDLAEFMRANAQDFKPFMEEEGMLYDEYIAKLMTDGVYGGNDTIVAFTRCYNCTVVIHQPNSPKWEVHDSMIPAQATKQRCFHIAYLNGEHYCSVVPVDPLTDSDSCCSRSSTLHESNHEKVKQTTPHCTHSGTGKMHGMCEETNVVEALMESSGCMDMELVESVLRDNSYDYDMAIVELLQIMDVTGKDSSYIKPPLQISPNDHSPIVMNKETKKAQSHLSNRKRKEIAKKERKERRAKQKQTDKITDIESVDDSLSSLFI